jgi:hypothetical protein
VSRPFGTQVRHPLDAQPVGRHLGAEVGQALARDLAVQQDQFLHVGLQLAFPVQPDRRDAQAFLIDVGMAPVGEIGVVGGVDRPAGDLAIIEDRLGQHDVGQVRSAALEGVVADEDIAGPDLRQRVAPHDVRDDADEAAEMHRDVFGLAQRVAPDVEQRRRAVAPLLDVGGIAGADQRFAHLLRDRGKGAADDFDGDRVN